MKQAFFILCSLSALMISMTSLKAGDPANKVSLLSGTCLGKAYKKHDYSCFTPFNYQPIVKELTVEMKAKYCAGSNSNLISANFQIVGQPSCWKRVVAGGVVIRQLQKAGPLNIQFYTDCGPSTITFYPPTNGSCP